MKLKFIMIVSMLTLTISAIAQDNKYNLNYIIGFPTGATADFTESTSWRGIGFDYTHMIDKQWGFGASIEMQTFYDELGKVTTTEGTETITANRYNYINSIPLYLTGSYFLNETGKFTPFVALGIGTMYNNQEQDLGLYTIEQNAWQFSMRPEIGFEYEINYGFGLRGAFRYNYASKSGDLEGFSHLGLAIGVVWSN
ncbi:outer membrane beta-barrel protein [Formosa sp. PL04]|uniref:outer membrane beta-barrel protein n=1 Tax=Formosa sp. PL04 TaxID=3081755 RepID=UPI002980A7EB|nr:outer membrane beta-barrel protein [Formosa sp. PL04]MDW5288920.1 outer membrane beta-barrel protein [Formosa sp. PL04]